MEVETETEARQGGCRPQEERRKARGVLAKIGHCSVDSLCCGVWAVMWDVGEEDREGEERVPKSED